MRTPARTAWVIERQPYGEGPWYPVAAWWTRKLAREDKAAWFERYWESRFRIVPYRPYVDLPPLKYEYRGDR